MASPSPSGIRIWLHTLATFVSPRGGVTLTPCIKYGAGSRSSPERGGGVTLTPVSSTGQALDPFRARRGSHPHPNPLPEGEGVKHVEGEGAGESPSPRIKYGAGSRSSPGEEGESPSAQPSPSLMERGQEMGHSCLAAHFALMSAREGESPSLPVSSTGQAPGDGSHPHLNPLPGERG